MWWILDLFIVSIVALYVYSSAKRGFVRTVVEFVGYFVAIFLSITLSGVVSVAIYDSFISPGIVEDITDEASLSSASGTDEKVDRLWKAMPDIVVNNKINANISKNTLKNTVENNDSDNISSDVLVKKVTDATVKPTVVPIIKTVVTVVLFFILMFIIKILAKFINKVFNLPIIGKLNKLLGGAVGFFKGAIFATIFVMIVMFFVSITKNGFLFFTPENIEQSILFKFLAGFSPFK